MRSEPAPFGASAAGLVLLLLDSLAPLPAHAQQALDVEMGTWAVPGADPTVYTVGLRRPLLGPFDGSLVAFGLVDPDPSGRSLYGLGPEITATLGGDRLSPYLVAGTGLALDVGGPVDVTAVWSAGAGLDLRLFPWLAVRAEARRLVEDRHVRGFWNLLVDDRRGWQLSAGVSVRWGGASGGRTARSRGAAPPPAPVRIPAEADASALRAQVVQTALSMMGEPYRWGGNSAARGFDCSGLVWYAYRAHGIDIPRVSRDQARIGSPIPAGVAHLRPGDILLFSDDPPRVTHVGLYVGDGRFIHSTNSGGVTIGSLDPDAEAFEEWWLARWLGARRVLGP